MRRYYDIRLRDPRGWRMAVAANSDYYGTTVMVYAEHWAYLMEQRINWGLKLAEVAEECARLANPEGKISSIMQGCAAHILARLWVHGDDLLRWYQQRHELLRTKPEAIEL